MFELGGLTVEAFTPDQITAAMEMHRRTWCAEHRTWRPRGIPWEGYIPPLWTWRCDPVTGIFDVLVEIPLDEVEHSEAEDRIRVRDPFYPLYVQWAEEGFRLPANVVRNVYTGVLTASCNRRRVLAARDAGKEKLLAWFSETDMQTHNALWALPRVDYQRVPVGADFWTCEGHEVKDVGQQGFPAILQVKVHWEVFKWL